MEQLDIKFTTEFDAQHTTHVVSRKRNTPKGLQALINAKYIVTDEFVNALVEACAVPDGSEESALESNFDASWPRESAYVPPKGEESVERPPELFAPNPARKNVFDGYTFVFYERKQFENLLGPITSGKGKALLKEAAPGETQIDDFIRYVKGVAGEKGLGEFEDGSEGKGVVVVRFMPVKGDHIKWFEDFATTVSLRLDHRLIEQREFLDAVVMNDASTLRRPLESEVVGSTPEGEPVSRAPLPLSVLTVATVDATTSHTTAGVVGSSAGSARREASAEVVGEARPPGRSQARPKRAIPSRFKGFDLGEESIVEDAPMVDSVAPESAAATEEHANDGETGGTSKRKLRSAAVVDNAAVLGDLAPTATAVKRRRIDRGEDPVPKLPEPVAPAVAAPSVEASPKKVPKKELDILDMARQHREEAEARALAEKAALSTSPDAVDLDEIRRLAIVEEIRLRQAPAQRRTREADVADGRWDPRWNGRKNFKRFRARGEPAGRLPQRVIVQLEEARKKDFGIADEYWLEGERQRGTTGNLTDVPMTRESEPRRENVSHAVSIDSDDDGDSNEAVSAARSVEAQATTQPSRRVATAEALQTQPPNTGTRSSPRRPYSGRATASATAASGKRPAASPTQAQPSKKSRPTIIADSDESDDELKFRFGRRH